MSLKFVILKLDLPQQQQQQQQQQQLPGMWEFFSNKITGIKKCTFSQVFFKKEFLASH